MNGIPANLVRCPSDLALYNLSASFLGVVNGLGTPRVLSDQEKGVTIALLIAAGFPLHPLTTLEVGKLPNPNGKSNTEFANPFFFPFHAFNMKGNNDFGTASLCFLATRWLEEMATKISTISRFSAFDVVLLVKREAPLAPIQLDNKGNFLEIFHIQATNPNPTLQFYKSGYEPPCVGSHAPRCNGSFYRLGRATVDVLRCERCGIHFEIPTSISTYQKLERHVRIQREVQKLSD